ncbi:MobF family relaxase [Agromyces seonyuensis]|uniref:Relaxase domain-containing protein n=1 Tax=Agromyces seonyuensis TaxID=2662446 RepID=A0A6I4P6V7_9MICO|nr:MobF family relaxase [Agromyces seonyuensis]MWB99427.1 relaxase domain-containing protein [Agromyces seonyuensis]
MRVMSAGDGFRYLLRSVAAADGDRSASMPLTRYYAAKGTPPGRWMGSGVRALGGGLIAAGNEVTESQLQLLVGMGRDPVTGEALGLAYPVYSEGAARRRAVAGFDFTFSVPKSASILWGVADARTQEVIARAHHEAVADVLAFMEREVAATRTGAASGDGAVAQVEVVGLIAAAFDHFDSRAGDPHLHTHVVISNKVQTVLDGKWRSLDGRPLHAAVVALSELHEALFADRLTRALGVQWEQRARGHDRNPAWSVASVPEALVEEFSTRARHIDAETDRLIAVYVAEHGRRPRAAVIMKLRAQATLTTRPEKTVRSLADLTATWRARAGHVLGTDATAWARNTTVQPALSVLRAEDVPLEETRALGAQVVHAVSEKRATWRHWNLAAEAARQTMQLRFATTFDREAVIGLVVDAAETASLQLTPPELATSPATFSRDDGTSVFRPRHSQIYTSIDLIEAESRLLERTNDATAPKLAPAVLREQAREKLPGGGTLAADQYEALAAIAGSGRVLDVLVGPAGAGKTTAMNALRRAWEREYGPRSVVGLAPSAAAALVLAADLGIATENLAKWWAEHLAHGASFTAGQLVIVDEASLASTHALDRVSALAADAGAKVLLVGDHAQLQSVDAGGAFAMLVHDRADAPELTDVHRFVEEWEKAASLALRRGDPEVIDRYVAHDRVQEGSGDAMADAAYLAWREDARAGRASVLISDSNDAVAALNLRARTDGILDGRVDARREVGLRDGTAASVGDTVITRRNDRRLRAGRAWVRNGDRWTVLAVRRGGALEVRKAGSRWGAPIVLPPGYVREHLELGYAVTSHRAQGITTERAHVVVAAGMTRENFYVAMTRGRRANLAYVALDRPDSAHGDAHLRQDDRETARSILFGVLAHVGAELSAHETLVAEHEQRGSIAQLAAEYETLAAAAQHDRWVGLVRASGLAPAQVDAVVASDAFGPLGAELRRVEASHQDASALLASVVASRGFEDAQDIAAVLVGRVRRAIAEDARGAGRARRSPLLVAGLIPRALGEMDDETRHALVERSRLIESRARELVARAQQAGEPWVGALGEQPRGSAAGMWLRSVATVAAYRDRYGVIGVRPLGAAPVSQAQKTDFVRAEAALVEARRLAQTEVDEQRWGMQNVRSSAGDVGLRV